MLISLKPEITLSATGVRAILVNPDHVSALVELAHHTEIHLHSGDVLRVEGSAAEVLRLLALTAAANVN